jgi:hypothetical protein
MSNALEIVVDDLVLKQIVPDGLNGRKRRTNRYYVDGREVTIEQLSDPVEVRLGLSRRASKKISPKDAVEAAVKGCLKKKVVELPYERDNIGFYVDSLRKEDDVRIGLIQSNDYVKSPRRVIVGFVFCRYSFK